MGLTVWCRSWRVIQLQTWSLLAALTHHCLSYNKMSISYLLPTLLCLSSILGQSADYDPLYLGKFSDLAHSVGGDIFVLDEKTIYIQDFSHDGQAPDVFFWADGVIIPYITRSNLEPQIGLQRFLPRRMWCCSYLQRNPQSTALTDWKFGAGHSVSHLGT